jgi:hypothetical protein
MLNFAPRLRSVKAPVRRHVLAFDLMEARVVLSPTSPMAPPPLVVPPPINLIDNPEEVIELQERQMIRDAAVDGLREMIEADRQKLPPGYVLPDFPPPPPYVEDTRTWYDQAWDALTDAINAATESQIPLFHP